MKNMISSREIDVRMMEEDDVADAEGKKEARGTVSVDRIENPFERGEAAILYFPLEPRD